MQTTKSRSASLEGTQGTSLVKLRSNRPTKVVGSESDSASTHQQTKSLTVRSPNVIRHQSLKTTTSEELDKENREAARNEKRRPGKVMELEHQIVQLQEDLKKTRDQLSLCDSWRRQAQQEAEQSKEQLLFMSAELENSQQELVDLSSAEEARIQQLRKISQERDRAWQSELEAIQKQNSMNSAALASAKTEIQRLKRQLEMVRRSEASQSKQSEFEHSELQSLKEDMVEALSTIENLKVQLRDTEKAEAEAKAMLVETTRQLESAWTTAETLISDGSKLMDSFSLVASELEESRARVNLLEDMMKRLQDDQSVASSYASVVHKGRCSIPHTHRCGSLESEVERLQSELEAAQIKYMEEQIRNIVQIQCANELIEQTRIDSRLREDELQSALNNAKSDIILLKVNLFDKETELQSILEMNKKLHVEMEKGRTALVESELERKPSESIADVAELKVKLMDKEALLQSISEENEHLKLETKEREMERLKAYEVAAAAVETARAAEQEARMRLRCVSEEADNSSRRAAIVAEQLDTAQTMKLEMEAEVRRLRVQSDQWRKAAEAAMDVLPTEKDGRLSEETSSGNPPEYRSAVGGLMSSPFSDDLDDESPRKKNSHVLWRFSGIWKKGQK